MLFIQGFEPSAAEMYVTCIREAYYNWREKLARVGRGREERGWWEYEGLGCGGLGLESAVLVHGVRGMQR